MPEGQLTVYQPPKRPSSYSVMGEMIARTMQKRRDLNARLLMFSLEPTLGPYSAWPRLSPWWMRLLRWLR